MKTLIIKASEQTVVTNPKILITKISKQIIKKKKEKNINLTL